MIKVATFILIVLFSSTLHATPTQYKTVDDLFESLSDYSAEDETFKVISRSPLHIHILPTALEGESTEIIQKSVKRAIIYGIYRTFIHTKTNQITVTATPAVLTFPIKRTPAKKYEKSVKITRKQAKRLIKKHLGSDRFSFLIQKKRLPDGSVINDFWSKSFYRIYVNDQGKPGLNRFYKDLAKYEQ